MRKEEIRAAATRLFAERGYDGASMGDLAAHVGIRKASLFHHFESKQALYADVLSNILSDVAAAIVNSGKSAMSFPERVDFITDSLIDLFYAKPYAARLLFRETMNVQAETRVELLGALGAVYSTGIRFVEEGQAAGEFSRALAPAHTVFSFVGIFGVPFSMPDVVEALYGGSPFGAEFLDARKREVRLQVRLLLLAR